MEMKVSKEETTERMKRLKEDGVGNTDIILMQLDN